MFDVDVRWLPRSPVRLAVDPVVPARGPAGAAAAAAADRSNPMSSPRSRAASPTTATCSCSFPASARSDASNGRSPACLPAPTSTCTPLAGALTLEEQDRALAPSPPGRRRVVLSTDIAETSLTVDGVRIVVDAGLAREPRFDARTGMSRLTTVHHEPRLGRPARRASRAHRAGRRLPAVEQDRTRHSASATARRRSPRPTSPGFALELAAWGRRSGDLRLHRSAAAAAVEQAADAARRPRRARR